MASFRVRSFAVSCRPRWCVMVILTFPWRSGSQPVVSIKFLFCFVFLSHFWSRYLFRCLCFTSSELIGLPSSPSLSFPPPFPSFTHICSRFFCLFSSSLVTIHSPLSGQVSTTLFFSITPSPPAAGLLILRSNSPNFLRSSKQICLLMSIQFPSSRLHTKGPRKDQS